ncbi:MAG TPA: class I poly(R)-hydroxyalkanoic acid synthase, partial [Xanthobacteraceae bacterium]|nr:class I poly(R)-hydroxyalkanoic acid synthase [Xanthobacteraceae bacterium]
MDTMQRLMSSPATDPPAEPRNPASPRGGNGAAEHRPDEAAPAAAPKAPPTPAPTAAPIQPARSAPAATPTPSAKPEAPAAPPVDIEAFSKNMARMVEQGGRALAAYLKPREEGRPGHDSSDLVTDAAKTLGK